MVRTSEPGTASSRSPKVSESGSAAQEARPTVIQNGLAPVVSEPGTALECFAPTPARTLLLEERDLPALYWRMRAQRLCAHVIQGDESLAGFQQIYRQGGLCKEVLPSGDIAAFWWTTHVYATAFCFHFCLFKPYRPLAAALFAKVGAGLEELGVSELFCPTPKKRRDLTGICRALGFEPVTTINKEILLWVAALKK